MTDVQCVKQEVKLKGKGKGEGKIVGSLFSWYETKLIFFCTSMLFEIHV
jgi:hypothetical protein